MRVGAPPKTPSKSRAEGNSRRRAMPPRRQSARRSPREAEVRLCIVLVAPPAGVDFGLQEGKGHDYETIQKQRSHGSHLTFHCTLKAKGNRGDGLPILLGPLAQGSPTGRFI